MNKRNKKAAAKICGSPFIILKKQYGRKNLQKTK